MMAQLSTKIEMYCTANGVASVDFTIDEIYKDMDAWKTRIAKVKVDNPKV
jgi:hypothetical protein